MVVNATYWKQVVGGFNWRGTYDAATYNIGDVVRYSSNSYIQLKDQQTNVTTGSDITVWTILAQGDTAAVLTTRGDILFESSGGVARLHYWYAGSVLASDGLDVKWSDISGKIFYMLSSTGDDNNLKERNHYLTDQYRKRLYKKAKEASITEVDNVNGGTGGTVMFTIT